MREGLQAFPPHVAVDDLAYNGETVVVHLPQHPVLQLVASRVAGALEYAAEVGDRSRGQPQRLCGRDPTREGPDVPRRQFPQRLLVSVTHLVQGHLGPGTRRHVHLSAEPRLDRRRASGPVQVAESPTGWSGEGGHLREMGEIPLQVPHLPGFRQVLAEIQTLFERVQ